MISKTPKKPGKRYCSASATVEAALVFPVFIFAIMALMYLMQIVKIKNDIGAAAYNTVRKLSEYSYAYEKTSDKNKAVSAVAAYATLIDELGSDYAKKACIYNGNMGISIAGSKFLEKDNIIHLKVTYMVYNPWDIFGFSRVKVSQSFYSQAWLGDEVDFSSYYENREDEMVFITTSGEVYHLNEECAYISLSVHRAKKEEVINLRNKHGGKYYPCESCMKNATYEFVYITDYGERYHSKEGCDKLKRTVVKVPKSAVAERRLCEKCGTEWDL